MKTVLKPLASKIRRKYVDLEIGKKIALYYLLLLFISLSASALINQKLYDDIISKKVIDVSGQTLDSIYLSVDSLISSVDLTIHLLDYNAEVQNLLAKKSEDEYFEIVSNLKNPISNLLLDIFTQNDNIDSIYLYSNYSFEYSKYKNEKKYLKTRDIMKTDLYREAFTGSVPYIVKLNADEIFEDVGEQNQKESFISIVRGVNSIETFAPLGVSIVNIPQSALMRKITEVSDKYGMDVLIRDESNREIVGFKNKYAFDINNLTKRSGGMGRFASIVHIGGKQYTVSYLKADKYNWTMVGITPTETISKDTYKLYVINLIILLVNSVLIFFIGSFIISRMITRPIKKLIHSMKRVENGEFKPVDIPTGNNELGRLRDGYNIMISEIQRLIRNIIEEQKLKRKYELGILHEQIKPHFLYNTFDSISSLALTAGNEDIYNLMCALGGYYKNSLSKGSEVITVKYELEIVKNYLVIQGYRYKDLFSVHYDIDESVLNYRVLKLVLQPLVENALYHGIKPKGEKGTIVIAAYRDENFIYLQVEDDGVGMEEDLVKAILSNEGAESKRSFGIRGTMERLRIFYNTEDAFTMESRIGQGTKAVIKIPVE